MANQTTEKFLQELLKPSYINYTYYNIKRKKLVMEVHRFTL